MSRCGKYGPPPVLTEEERREWLRQQDRKFVRSESNIKVARKGDGTKPGEGANRFGTTSAGEAGAQ